MDVVDPSTHGDVDSADGLVVPDGDDPATPNIPYDAVDPVDAPVIQDEVDPAISDAVAPMSMPYGSRRVFVYDAAVPHV